MTLVYPDLAALLLRVGFGMYMLLGHGMSKLKMLMSGAEVNFPSILGMSPSLSLGLAVFAEFLACVLIIVGYKTRLAALPVIITMIVAAFMIHGGDPFFMKDIHEEASGSKEPAMLYLIGFIAIYLLGSGRYSIDDKMDSVL